VGLKGYCELRGEMFDERLDEQLAPSLSEVYMGRGHEVYSDPVLFFESTYFSDSMRRVLRGIVEAVEGKGTRRVFPLFSLYGGGKTHLLLAVLHAVRKPESLSRVDRDLAVRFVEAGAKLVVLDGDSDELCPSPARPLDVKHYVVRSVWGSMAHQLGKYRFFEEEDRGGFAPSVEAIRKLLGDEPVIILIDEIAKYVARFRGSQDEKLRDYGKNVVAFVESLVKAVEGTRSVVVITLPVEVRGEEERYMEAYVEETKMLRDAIGRVASAYDVPLDAGDVVRVLQRRIFKKIDRDAVVALRSRYLGLYSSEEQVFGKSAVEKASRIDELAPFHPSYIDVLYDIVTRHPGLQRTRDALRITRVVVREIWNSAEDPDFVMPWHINVGRLDALLLGQSFSKFKPIVDRDIYDNALKRGPLVHAVALAIFVRTYVYGLATRPERVFPTREDVAFMVYEESLAKKTNSKPADVLNALDVASRELLFIQEKDGRYWFTPISPIIAIVQDEARRVSEVEARNRLLDAIRSLSQKPPPTTGKKKQEQQKLFSLVDVRDKPLPTDEPKYSLIIAPRVLSQEDLRRLIFEDEGGRSRVYRNTVAVLYPSDGRRFNRLLELARELIACENVEEMLNEIYQDEDIRELQTRKLRQYMRDRETQLYQEIINAFDTIGYPIEDNKANTSPVRPEATSLARIAEEALESPDVGKAYLTSLGYEVFEHLLKGISVDISEGNRELTVKEILGYFYTHPRLPFVARDPVIQALVEGVRNLKIGIQRGGQIYWVRTYSPENVSTIIEGAPPRMLEDNDIVLPWRIAAERLLQQLKPVSEKRDGKVIRIRYVLLEGGREHDLSSLSAEDATKLLKTYPLVRKEEEITEGIEVTLRPSFVEEKPGSMIQVFVDITPVGKVDDVVKIKVSQGEIEPVQGRPPFTAVWRLQLPDKPGTYEFEVSVEYRRPVSERLQVKVLGEEKVKVVGLVVMDLLESEDIVKAFPDLVFEEGSATLRSGEQEITLKTRNTDPVVFIEMVKEAMSLTGIRRLEGFSARFKFKQPKELPEIENIRSRFRSVEKIVTSI